MWARKSPRLGQYVRAARSASATHTVPHSRACATVAPVLSYTADADHYAFASVYVLLTR